MMTLSPEMIQFVRRQRLGYVATVNPDGTPNLSPKGTLTALDENYLLFANIASPNTLRNVQAGSAVEVNVLDIFARRGYRFRCTANVVTVQQQTAFESLFKFYLELDLNLSQYDFAAFILLKIESWSEVWSPAYNIGSDEASLKDFYYDYYKRE